MDLKSLQQQLERAKADIEEHGEAALKAEFSRFFAERPQVKTIYWSQYTPYFSDGDACYFGVYDAYIQLSDVPPSDDEDEDNPEETWPHVSSDAAARDFWGRVSALSEVFEAAFGDHVSVRATRDGFDVQEYEHD